MSPPRVIGPSRFLGPRVGQLPQRASVLLPSHALAGAALSASAQRSGTPGGPRTNRRYRTHCAARETCSGVQRRRSAGPGNPGRSVPARPHGATGVPQCRSTALRNARTVSGRATGQPAFLSVVLPHSGTPEERTALKVPVPDGWAGGQPRLLDLQRHAGLPHERPGRVPEPVAGREPIRWELC
jgi:hypothetical protein